MKAQEIKFARKCDCCGQGMNEGYVIEGGESYFCSKQCLNSVISDEQWEEMYDDDGDSYYTAWEDESDMEYILKDGKLTEI